MIRHTLKLIFLIVTSMLLAACDDGSNQPNEKSDEQLREKVAFEAYLKTKGVSVNDKARYDRMLHEYNRRKALTQAITQTDKLDQDMIEAEVRAFREQLLTSRYFEKFLANKVSDQSIENYYKSNIYQYKSRRVKVSHILFRVNARMQEQERQAQYTKAQAAYSKINAGEDFAQLAQQVSEDKVSAKKGGLLGWINQGAVSAAFSEKVFSMQAGEVSEPFVTDYGFHIIKIEQAPQDVTKSLQSVKGDIRYQLKSQSKKAEIERLLETVNFDDSGKEQAK